MGLIDVSEILSDPDFVDPITVIHREPLVDDFGQNKLKETSEPTVGSVQPASGKTLQRLPEAFRVSDVSSFWIRGKILSDGKSRYPDVLFFKGHRYAVQFVFDYTNWGDGFCEGTCVKEKPTL